MMNEILNLLELFTSQDERSDEEKKWALTQTDDEHLKKIISQLGLREFRIIGLFEINTDVSLKELPKTLGVSQASSSRSAMKLEELEIVTKHKTSLNNKEWLLQLTDDGQKLLEIKQKLDQRHQAKMAEIAADYSQEDLEKFTSFLRKIVQANSPSK